MRSIAPTVLLACLASHSAGATIVDKRELPDLIKDADHVVVATITKVDMVDGKGNEVTDKQARTGPGLKNQIRLHLTVKETLSTTFERPRKYAIVRLWQMWHYSLGTIQEETGQTAIFLLKGEKFDPAYPAYFQRPLEERQQIKELLRSQGNAKQ